MSRFAVRSLPLAGLWIPLLASVALLVSAPAATVVLERGPYLQQMQSTSVIVRWRTDVATDSRVEWGFSPTALTESADDPTLTTEHEVKIEGLSPYTQFFYRVGSTTQALAGGDADHFFRTAPPTGYKLPTRIWAIGDSGYPDPFVFSPGTWERNGDAVR